MPQPKLSLIQGNQQINRNTSKHVGFNNSALQFKIDSKETEALSFSEQQALVLSNELYQYLELNALIHAYQEKMREAIGIDSIYYVNPYSKLNESFNNKGRHYISYHLSFNQQDLGEIFFVRRYRFDDFEAQYIEKTLIAILSPLFNALKFYQAIQDAQTDQLTGALNRLGLDKSFDREINLARRNQSELSLLILDIDHFKKINDTYGHDFGDKILREMARHIQSCIRVTDVFARFGGEEFVVLLNNTNRSGALLLAERIRQQIAQTPEKVDGVEVHYTVSIGVANLLENDTRESFFKRADNALYQAKNNGRNRVVLSQQS